MNKKFTLLLITIFILLLIGLRKEQKNDLPLVAIANYGPHPSLYAAIDGFKKEMLKEGFVEKKSIKYQIADVAFDPGLVSQMISSLKAQSPKVIVVMATPIAQMAKAKIKDIPIIYNGITDPVSAGLIKDYLTAENNITGSSDKQDLDLFLEFAKKLLPNARKIGLLYSTSESNDAALVKLMRLSADKVNMEVVAVPIDHPRDIPIRMTDFQGKVDLIYVGTSGTIQPSLPIIANQARKMRIPIFNVEEQAVRDHLALASFGVDYHTVGKNTGHLTAVFLKGEKILNLKPLYPGYADHKAVINKKIADELNITILPGIEIVE